MSALAKLYATRGSTSVADAIRLKAASAPLVSLETTVQTVHSRHARQEKVDHLLERASSGASSGKEIGGGLDCSSALEVLETVNSGFVEIYERLQKSEGMNEKLVAECDHLEQRLRHLQSELDEAKQRIEETDAQNADLAERLIAETAQSSMLEERAQQAEHQLEHTRIQNEQIENVCKTLHDGIYAVFGGESATQRVLKTLGR